MTFWDRFASRSSSDERIILLSREGCGLCWEAERALRSEFGPVLVRVVDITTDRELEDAYVFRIPVVLVDGEVSAEGRIGRPEARALRAQLRARRRSRRR